MQAFFARYRAAYSGLPRDVWVMAIVLFVNRAGTMVLPFLTLYLTSKIQLTEALAARMVSVYGLGAVAGSYLGGRWAHRYGAVRVQTVCLLLSGPACLLIPLGSTWPPIALSLFTWSLFSSAVRPANAATIAKLTTPENRMRAFALQRLAANFGFSFGPTFGGLLATWKYGALFVVDGATSLAAFAALAYCFRFQRLADPEDDGSVPEPRSPLGDRQYVLFMLLVLAGSCVFFQFGSTYPLYLRDRYGMQEFQVGLMFGVNTMMVVAFEMLLVDAVKGLPLIRTVGWGTFLSCLGFGMLPWGSSAGFAVLAMVVMTIGEMLSASLSAAYASNRAPRGSEARYLGAYTLVLSLAWMIGPTIGGALYQRSPDLIWHLGTVVGIAALAGFLVLSRRVERAADEPPLLVRKAPLGPDVAYPAALELEEAV